MLDLEGLSMAAMELISYAGSAKSRYISALAIAKEHRFNDAAAMIKEGDACIAHAHKSHMGLLEKEANTLTPQVSLLMMHAEDQFMSCETIKLMVQEFIEIYKKEVN